MRTISAAQEKALSSPTRVAHLRVQVKDAGGTWRDMTALDGRDWVEGASWGETADQIASASVEFVRDVFKLNLAPLDQASKLNRLTGSYAPLLALNAELKIETATKPAGIAPAAGDWALMFHGLIDRIAWADSPVRVDCRDLSARLMDTWIETERIYGLERNYHLADAWAPSSPIPLGMPVRPTAGSNGAAYEYDDSLTGTSGSAEPAWSTAYNWNALDGVLGFGNWVTCWGPLPTQYGARMRQNSMAVAVGDAIAFPVAGSQNDLAVVVCTQAGTTAATTPSFSSWKATRLEITDGTAKFLRRGVCPAASIRGSLLFYGIRLDGVIHAIVLDHMGSADLVVPSTPAWMIAPWLQQRESVWDACAKLASMIGWEIRFAYDAASSSFKLTLREPNRSKTAPDRTFSAADYDSISSLGVELTEIRNVIQVVYSDSAELLSDGVNYARKTITASNSASVAKYGRRWGEIAEGSASLIDTATEATTLAQAAVADLCEPTAEQSAEMRYFPHVELGDLYRFTANGQHSSVDLDLAVVGYQHELTADGCGTTKLTCRGKPSGGLRQWEKRLVFRDPGRSARTMAPPTPTNVTVTNRPGLSLVSFELPRQDFDRAEIYVSTSSGFTPSSSTLYQSGRTSAFLVAKAAGTYYGKLVLRDRFGNAGAPSTQFTLAPT